MRTWSFLCVFTHWGWAHRQWISTTYLTRKNYNFSCAPGGIWTSVFLILSLTLYQLSPPSHWPLLWWCQSVDVPADFIVDGDAEELCECYCGKLLKFCFNCTCSCNLYCTLYKILDLFSTTDWFSNSLLKYFYVHKNLVGALVGNCTHSHTVSVILIRHTRSLYY